MEVARLELARPQWSTDFKSGVSTDSTTLPRKDQVLHHLIYAPNAEKGPMAVLTLVALLALSTQV